MGRSLLIFILAVSLNSWADTTIYKRVRPDGTVEFSDAPISGGVAVQVPDVLTFPSPAPKSAPAAKGQPEAQQQPEQILSYEAIQVTTPTENATLFFDEGGMPVTVNIRPGLQPGHVVAVYLDGQLVAKGPQSSFTLKEVFRGSHTLAAAILDESESELVSSNPVSFQMIQHSILD